MPAGIEKKADVTAFDISDKALKIFRNEIITRKVKIKIFQAEVENLIKILKPDLFDSILISRFKPNFLLIEAVYQLLKEKGIFMFTSFNLKHNSVNPQPNPEKCYLHKNELFDAHKNLRNELYEEFEFNGGYYNGYIFKKI